MTNKWWDFCFTGSLFWIRTPLFVIVLASGASDILAHAWWWGIEICWDRNKYAIEGDYLFRKSKRITFKYLTAVQARQLGIVELTQL